MPKMAGEINANSEEKKAAVIKYKYVNRLEEILNDKE